MKIRMRLTRIGVVALALTLGVGVTAVAATAKKAPRLSGSIAADGSSTVGPCHDGCGGDVPAQEPPSVQHHGRDLGHGRRLRALLPRRDRPGQRVAADPRRPSTPAA